MECAFPETVSFLRAQLQACAVDCAAFRRLLAKCDLRRCHGTCCHDGVYLGTEEAVVIRGLADDRSAAFLAQGLRLPERVVVYGTSAHTSGPKTATRPAPLSRLAESYPPHFPETACVFLGEGARCGLQRLAASDSRDPWYYKPLSCWMHPISLVAGEAESLILTLHDEATDPQREAGHLGFVSQTPCGRTCPTGEPAWKVLHTELSRLGEIANRDFLGEIESWPGEAGSPVTSPGR